MIKIIAVNIENKIGELDTLYHFLQKEEVTDVLKFRQDIDKLRSAVSCLLKKYILYTNYMPDIPKGIDISQSHFEDLNQSIAVEIRKLDRCQYNNKIEHNNYGKPSYKDYPELKFNLTHSGNWVVAAYTDNEIGIDCEEIKSIDSYPDIAKRFYSDKEYDYLLQTASAAEQIDRFYEIWTKKESFIKAVGKGLSLSLTTFSVPISRNGFISYDNKLWFIKQVFLKDSNYKAAVCSDVDFNYEILYLNLNEIVKNGKMNKNLTNKEKKEYPAEDVFSICGDALYKLEKDDGIDPDDVYDRPIIPGTSGVEC